MFEDTISVVSIWAAMNSWLTPTVLFVVLNIMIGTIAVTSGLGAGPRPETQDQDPAGDVGRRRRQQQQPHPQNQQQQQLSPLGQLTRSPSLVLQRLRSITLYRSERESPPTNPLIRAPGERVALVPSSPRDADPVVRRFEAAAEKENVAADTAAPAAIPVRENLAEQKEASGKGETGQVAVERQESLEEVFNKIQVGEKNSTAFTRSKSDKKPGVAEIAAAAAERKVAVPKKRAVKKSASDKATFSHFGIGDPVQEEDVVVRKRVTSTPTAADEEVDARADDFINRFKEQLKLQRMESLMAGGGEAGN